MGSKKVKNILSCDRRDAIVLRLGRIKKGRVCVKLEDRLDPFYRGYRDYKDIIMRYVAAPLGASICVTDDFGLHVIEKLQVRGYKNITLMITDDDAELAERFLYYIKQYYHDGELNGINIKTMEECMGMKFNLIISNPPYEVGNEITRNIIKNIGFDEFINLMPLSSYKKGSLYRYIEEKMQGICAYTKNTFDAHTAPDVCMISKTPSEYRTYDQFELKFYYDKRLSKFWEENSSRKRSFLEHICICAPRRFNTLNSKTSFACGIYTPHDKVHAIKHLENRFVSDSAVKAFLAHPDKKLSRDCSEEYIWNVCKPDCAVEKCFVPVSSGNINQIFTVFASEKEKDNFVNWWYSAERNGKNPKSGLASILLAGLNKPTDCPFDQAIPNVDWTRSWTDEKILKDYGYSDSEIKEILSLGQNDLYRHALLDY